MGLPACRPGRGRAPEARSIHGTARGMPAGFSQSGKMMGLT